MGKTCKKGPPRGSDLLGSLLGFIVLILWWRSQSSPTYTCQICGLLHVNFASIKLLLEKEYHMNRTPRGCARRFQSVGCYARRGRKTKSHPKEQLPVTSAEKCSHAIQKLIPTHSLSKWYQSPEGSRTGFCPEENRNEQLDSWFANCSMLLGVPLHADVWSLHSQAALPAAPGLMT